MNQLTVIRNGDVIILTWEQLKEMLIEAGKAAAAEVLAKQASAKQNEEDGERELNSEEAAAYCNLKSPVYFKNEYLRSGLPFTPGRPNYYKKKNLDKFKDSREKKGSAYS